MKDYSDKEMMAISAGRLVNNKDIIFVGTGVSMLAATVAKKIHAPEAVFFFETGGIDPSLIELPLAVGDPRVMVGTSVNTSLPDSLSLLAHAKLQTLAFLGAAQIDRFGNLNSTLLGSFEAPTNRFPGAGGACEAASLAAGFFVFMQHEKRRFVPELDYRTSPGWISGGRTREQAGFVRGGPLAVITNLGVLRFNETSREMYLAEHYPGVAPEVVQEHTGFELDISRSRPARPPMEEELSTLREEVDPQRLILGK